MVSSAQTPPPLLFFGSSKYADCLPFSLKTNECVFLASVDTQAVHGPVIGLEGSEMRTRRNPGTEEEERGPSNQPHLI